MPSWLKTVLKLVGLGASEYLSVRTGTKESGAVIDGIAQAKPLVEELVSEIHPKKQA